VFRFALSEAHRIEFEPDGEGRVVAFTGIARGAAERMPRLVPAADLPSVAELQARKQRSLGAAVEALGPARVSATLDMPTPGLNADVVITVDGLARWRTATDYGSLCETTLVNADRAWFWSPPASKDAGLHVIVSSLRDPPRLRGWIAESSRPAKTPEKQ
jgi:hypothetical protein